MIFTGIFLFICIIIDGMILPSIPAPKAADPAAASSDPSQQSSVYEISKKYILSSYNRYVAAYRYGEEKPFYISGTLINDLPKSDREMLKNGIGTNSKKDLDRLLHDFTS